MKNRWAEASIEDEGRDNPAPHPSALQQQPEHQPEEGREEHSEVMCDIHQVAHRVLLVTRSRLRRRVMLVTVACRSVGSGAKVQGPEEPVAQKERAHKKERK
jgi:hypothetical protein